MQDFNVTLSPVEAARMAETGVMRSGMSVECIDRYYNRQGGTEVAVLVFDKYFMRNSSRASLTVTIENLSGVTRVHAAGSGGSQNALFNIDWGAAASFEDAVRDALWDYVAR